VKVKKYIISILIFIISISLLTALLREHISLLWAYSKLTSSDEVLQRLQQTPPPVKFWKSLPDNKQDLISVGYAEFVYPSGEISGISCSEHGSVKIISPVGEIAFSTLTLWKKALEEAAQKLPLHENRFYLENGSLAITQGKLSKGELKIMQLVADDDYSYKKSIMTTYPKSLFSLLFMSTKDLYVYEQMIEMKNMWLKNTKSLFFETENIKGIVILPYNDPKHVTVEIWDSKMRFFQGISIKQKESFSIEPIQTFLSSFHYTVEPCSSDEISTLILETVRNHPKYRDWEDVYEIQTFRY
jgi:hypothetical protein